MVPRWQANFLRLSAAHNWHAFCSFHIREVSRAVTIFHYEQEEEHEMIQMIKNKVNKRRLFKIQLYLIGKTNLIKTLQKHSSLLHFPFYSPYNNFWKCKAMQNPPT